MNFKEIHIGQLLRERAKECDIEMSRICSFMKCTEMEVEEMYISQNIDTEILLKWSKLLKYDFFRMYSQHLIFFAPPAPQEVSEVNATSLPKFRKNIYTKNVIDFILELIENGEMSKSQIMKRYRIPKTTLYKWTRKYTK